MRQIIKEVRNEQNHVDQEHGDEGDQEVALSVPDEALAEPLHLVGDGARGNMFFHLAEKVDRHSPDDGEDDKSEGRESAYQASLEEDEERVPEASVVDELIGVDVCAAAEVFVLSESFEGPEEVGALLVVRAGHVRGDGVADGGWGHWGDVHRRWSLDLYLAALAAWVGVIAGALVAVQVDPVA